MSSRERSAPSPDPRAEAVFRVGYRRGWLACVDTFAQLLGDHDLTGDQAAAVLKAHHGRALKRWESDTPELALYPPRIGKRQLKVGKGAAE